MKLFDRLGKLRDRRRPYCTMIVPAAGESRRMGGGNKLLLPLEGSLPGEEQMREQLLSVYNVTVPMHTDGTQEGFRRVCRVYRREGI